VEEFVEGRVEGGVLKARCRIAQLCARFARDAADAIGREVAVRVVGRMLGQRLSHPLDRRHAFGFALQGTLHIAGECHELGECCLRLMVHGSSIPLRHGDGIGE
jgi:hypothetical protein